MTRMAAKLLLFQCIFIVSVGADFNFTVRFYEYWNPTGLCAECGTNGIQVCCDDPQRTESCQNTGVFRCDTRFRFIQRPFNASVETAPSGGFPYFTRSITNENHHTFPERPFGFLILPNPHTSTNTSAWTGRIQFLVDAFDRINTNKSPNETEGIVDRFLINLDQLQLGADLTEKTNYSGIYGISQLSMSFRVECSENYYGSDCTTFCEAVEGVYTCDSNGNIVCVEDKLDPSTDCLSCPQLRYDPSTNCTQCLPGRDSDTNCTTCSENYYGSDCTTFCEAVEGVYTCDSDGNIVCVEDKLDPSTNCSQCLPGRNTSTNCTSCLAGYTGHNCVTDPCLSSQCENGATCTPDGTTGDYQCDVDSHDISNAEIKSTTLTGGVVGGIAGVLCIFCTLMVIILVLMKRGRMKTTDFAENGATSPTQQTPDDDIELKQNIVYGVNPTKTRKIELETNQAYGVTSGERLHQEEDTYYTNGTRDPRDQPDKYDYV